jgi:heterodisulfide reductase subunit A
MTVALALSRQGFPVHLVERKSELGGNLRFILTAPANRGPEHPRNPQNVFLSLVEQVTSSPNISIHLQSEITKTRGFVGNFISLLKNADGSSEEILHGVTILAVGGREYDGNEYGYGSDPRILSQQSFESILTSSEPQQLPSAVAMILCVGPAKRYCSRICCSVAIKNALALKEKNPQAQVILFYQDIRTYGFYEQLYTEARRKGVLFLRYTEDCPPQITGNGHPESPLTITAWETNIRRPIEVHPDLIVLSMPVTPQPDAHAIAARFKVPVDADGFLLEAHVKLRPVDFASDGIFMAGLAHYPKSLDESIIQALAAAARAGRILSRETLTAGGRVAVVDPALCTGCLTCVRICPFNVPRIQPDLVGVGGIMGAAQFEAAICQGCGSCAAECPARAIQLMHYTDSQIIAKLDALVENYDDLLSINEIPVLFGELATENDGNLRTEP